jgi:hypothetical protein
MAFIQILGLWPEGAGHRSQFKTILAMRPFNRALTCLILIARTQVMLKKAICTTQLYIVYRIEEPSIRITLFYGKLSYSKNSSMKESSIKIILQPRSSLSMDPILD